jgi:predicted acylesterase/phospholipase RssA
MSKPAFAQLDTLAFAGGGNRCWWQAGAVSHLLERGFSLPRQLIGTSAGAGVAASLLTGGVDAALAGCQRLYGETARIFDWRALSRFQLRFAHQHVYPAWVASFVDAAGLSRLKAAEHDLAVAIARPARALGLAGSVLVGAVAYLIDKKLAHRIHPALPKYLGLRQEFHSLSSCASVDEAHLLLCAAAAAPPFMSAPSLQGRWALDGGFVDNAPIPGQSDAERRRTLVLLTRHYPKRPAIFQEQGRWYWQPSQPVPVSTFDCTAKATVQAAFALGVQDARASLDTGLLARD